MGKFRIYTEVDHFKIENNRRVFLNRNAIVVSVKFGGRYDQTHYTIKTFEGKRLVVPESNLDFSRRLKLEKLGWFRDVTG